jgi:hypothetical protein
MLTAMKLFVFSPLFQVGRSVQWTRVRVPKYSGSCKWARIFGHLIKF